MSMCRVPVKESQNFIAKSSLRNSSYNIHCTTLREPELFLSLQILDGSGNEKAEQALEISPKLSGKESHNFIATGSKE